LSAGLWYGGFMFPLNMSCDFIYFKDIKLEHLPYILKWYNKVDDFKFATGIDTPITLEVLTQKYAEVAICGDEFFTGIYNKEEKMIGILKGRLKYKNRDAVWISSIVIDTEYQHRGYGRVVINLLLNYLKEKNKVRGVYLAVVEENLQGRTFWLKQSFKELRRIENHLKLQDKQRNVIIMYKQI
jgi:ribosomal protein S18 acetylase RimI-like enzyme